MTDQLDTQIAIWNVSSGTPARMMRGSVDYEKKLEDWIEADPTLIQRNLTIVGRQINMGKAKGRLDLLALDSFGQWIILELKRGEINRDTVAQALDYAGCIDEMSADELAAIADTYLRQRGSTLEMLLHSYGLGDDIFSEKDIQIYVVGTGRDQNLERLVRHTRFKDQPISVVTFEVFESQAGERLLIRKLTELDNLPEPHAVQVAAESTIAPTIDSLFAMADENGVGEGFRAIYDTCTGHGLYPRLYKWSIMYTPTTHKGRCLVVAWVYPKYGKLRAYAIPETFSEFFPISEQDAATIIGDGREQLLELDEVPLFLERLEALFDAIDHNT